MDPNELLDTLTGDDNAPVASSSGTGMTWGQVLEEKVIPDGAYHCRVKKAIVKQPKRSVNDDGDPTYPYTSISFVIQEEGEFLGQYIFENFTHKPGFMFLIRQMAEKAGLDLAELAQEEYDPAVFIDCEVIVVGEVVPPSKAQKELGFGPRFRTKKFKALHEV